MARPLRESLCGLRRSTKRMKESLKYRTLALSLATVFMLFNVGLPIIVAACPMEKLSGGIACFGCIDASEPLSESVSRFSDRSCCETVVAAGRNTTEFVQAKSSVETTVKWFVVAEPWFSLPVSVLQPPVSLKQIHSPSPPSEDIPVFTSSFLI